MGSIEPHTPRAQSPTNPVSPQAPTAVRTRRINQEGTLSGRTTHSTSRVKPTNSLPLHYFHTCASTIDLRNLWHPTVYVAAKGLGKCPIDLRFWLWANVVREVVSIVVRLSHVDALGNTFSRIFYHPRKHGNSIP